MTRKHFEALALTLYTQRPAPSASPAAAQQHQAEFRTWVAIVYAVAATLSESQPSFNRERFIAACGA